MTFEARDIPEGADQSDMPRFGCGKIKTAPWIEEIYLTVCLFGWRFFLVRAHSGDHHYWRHWLRRAV